MSIHAGSRRTVLLAIVLLASLILSVSAACPDTKLNVPLSNVIIENSGALTPGTGFVMAIRIDFPDKENTTYPATSQLELTSGLDTPAWSWNIVREGIKRPETEERKSRVVIGGGDLAYPANTSISLEIKLYGTTPSVTENKKLTVMRIQDIAGTACIGEVYRYNAWVLNTTITEERITGLSRDLGQLRADAAAQQQEGADTSGIMRKIDEAQRSLDEANSTPVFEFVSVGLALNRTESAITNGRRLLAEVQVTGTTPVQQAKTAATTRQTPASPEPVAIPFLAVSGAGIAILVTRRRADR